MVRSPNSLEKVTNDGKTSTEMELYKKDDDVDDIDEEVILEDEKALSGNHIQMKLKNFITIGLIRAAKFKINSLLSFCLLQTSVLCSH